MEWSSYQKEIFEWIERSSDSLIIEAVAGSGKTTTIVEAIKHVPSSQSVIFLAFNKSIADELRRRVTQPNARCMTLHSLGLTAWKQHLQWDAGELEIDGGKTRAIVDELKLEYGEWTKEMTKLVGLAKGGGLTPKELVAAGFGTLLLDSQETWDELMDRYDIDFEQVDLDLVREVLAIGIQKAREVIDFDDMLYMPVIAGSQFEKVDVVFLDEAQDVNNIQAEIVSRMLHTQSRVVAVGDPHQAIYGFRGAMQDSMEQLGKRFHCTQLPLSVSYRCPKGVVTRAREWVSHILASESAIDGLVEHCPEWNVKDFLPGDAILCRNARPVVAVAFHLIRNKVAARVVGRDIGQGLVALVNKMKARTIADLDARLSLYRAREVGRLQGQKGSQGKIAALDDKLETVRVFMEEAGPHAGIGTLIASIESLFGESQEMRGMVTCSTVHKSKGLEFERVFVLDAGELMPSRWARQEWELQQEFNLCYVAATRAKRELRYISSEGLRTEVRNGSQTGCDVRGEDAGARGVAESEVRASEAAGGEDSV
jgi:superfamily I DNA/RNA helicase